MKRDHLLLLLFSIFSSIGLYAQTNDFYDDAPTSPLKSSGKILITGEVEKDMVVDLAALPLRNVIVKETTLGSDKPGFTGAYKYDGYSLYDILDGVVLKKKNASEFPPIIDLYVEVSNEAGEKVVLSWGEIYYPNFRHQIMVATAVTRIVPSKTKDLWPLPTDSKLVVGPDLVTVRNISNPTRITVRSLDSKYEIKKDLSPMLSEKIRMCVNGAEKSELTKIPKKSTLYTYNTVFYGRGKGIHGTTPFKGVLLSSLLNGMYNMSADNLQKGLVVIAGVDGYHSAFTLSEIVNRNDQQELLVVDRGKEDGAGFFSIFPACDFFSDRAVKSVMEINLLLP